MSEALRPSQRFASYLIGAFGLGISAMAGLLVPLRASQLGISVAMIGVIVAARATAEALVSFQLGRAIDRFGAIKAFRIGTSICVAVGVGFAIADSLAFLLVLQIIFGLGRALGWIGSQVHISSVGVEETQARETGRFSFASYVGQVVTPALVGFVAVKVGYEWAFLTMSAYALSFTGLGFLLTRTLPGSQDTASGNQVIHLARNPMIRGALVLTAVRLWISSIWHSFYPLFLVIAGLTAATAGLVVSAASFVAMFMPLTVGLLARRSSAMSITSIALGLSGIGVILSPLSSEGWAVLLPAVLMGVGGGLSLPLLITMISNAAPSGSEGAALGARSTVNQASSAVAPIVTAQVIQTLGVTIGFVMGGGIALAVIGLNMLVIRRHTRGSF